MALDARITLDMGQNITAVRARVGLEFYLIPSRKMTMEAPWLMVDKGAKLRPRIQQALRTLRGDTSLRQQFFLDKAVSGRIEVIARRLVFIADEMPSFDIETFMQSKWSLLLKNEGGDVEKFGILLRKAVFKDERAAMELAATEGDETYDGDLSATDLEAIFGPDTEAVATELPELAQLNKQLSGIQRSTGSTSGEQTQVLLAGVMGAGVGDLGSELQAQVGQFLKMVVSELPRTSAKVGTGEEVDTSDKVLGLAAEVNRYIRCLVAWERRVDAALDLQGYLDALEAKDELTPDENLEYSTFLEQYNVQRSAALEAQKRATEIFQALKSAHEGTTSSSSTTPASVTG